MGPPQPGLAAGDRPGSGRRRWARLGLGRRRLPADEHDPVDALVVRVPGVAVDDLAVRVADGAGHPDLHPVDRVLDPLRLPGPEGRRVLDRVDRADDVPDRRRA